MAIMYVYNTMQGSENSGIRKLCRGSFVNMVWPMAYGPSRSSIYPLHNDFYIIPLIKINRKLLLRVLENIKIKKRGRSYFYQGFVVGASPPDSWHRCILNEVPIAESLDSVPPNSLSQFQSYFPTFVVSTHAKKRQYYEAENTERSGRNSLIILVFPCTTMEKLWKTSPAWQVNLSLDLQHGSVG